MKPLLISLFFWLLLISIATDKTWAQSLQKPAVPKNLAATSSPTQIDFNWQTGDGGGAPQTFDWQCSTDKTFAKRDKEGNTSQKAITIPELQPGTLYYLRVQARNATGVSGWSAHIEKSTLDAPPAVPSISGLNTAADGKSIKIDWKNNSANTSKIEIQWSEDLSFGSKADNLPPNPTTYTVDKLSPCKKYNFRIRSFSAGGTASGWSANISKDTQLAAPGAPANLKLAPTLTEIEITWEAGSGAIDSYTCEWGTSESYGNTAPVSGTTAKVPNLSPTTAYYFKITASNCGGKASVTSKTTTKAPEKPAAPTNLRTTGETYKKIALAWNNTVGDAKGTEVERKVGGGNFTVLKTFGNGTQLTHDDIEVQPRTSYTYRVRISKDGIPSDYSNEKTATTPTPPAPSSVVATQTGVNASGKPIIKIAWTNNWPEATVFEVQRSENQSSGFGKIDRNDSGGQLIDENTACGKTYYYRVIANLGLIDSDPSGSSNAVIATCQPAKPKAPANLSATSFSSSQINLTWTDVADETGYEVERSTDGNNFTKIGNDLAANSTSFQDNGLSASTKYFYRIRGKNSAGNGDFSNVANATTSAPPTVKPNAPANLTASAVSNSQINLSWNDVADETGYEVERSTDGNSFSKIGNDLGANSTSYQDNGLSASTKYYYRIRGKNSAGNGDFSNIANATTSAPTPIKPSAPTNLSATAVSSSQINLTWTDVADETGYEVERSTDGNSFTKIGNDLAANSTSYQDNGLSASTKYFYRVRGKNSAGNGDFSNVANATTSAPPTVKPNAPANLTASAVSNSQINLSWNDVADETGYEVERSTDGNSFSKIGNDLAANSTSFQDNGLTASTKYYYRIRGKNGAGTGDFSNVANATTSAPTPVKPSAPTNLSATAVSSSQINLTWTDVADETGYELERSTDGNNFVKIGSELAVNATSYQDPNLSASTKYFYRVRGKNSAGNGDFSNVANATTSAPPTVKPNAPANLTASAVSSSQINLSWNDVADEGGYEVERSTDGNSFSKIGNDLGANSTSYQDNGLSASTKYFYRVRGKNSAGNGDFSNVANATTSAPPTVKPNAPANLTASAVSNSQINLSWNDVADEAGYEVERSTDGNSFSKIGNDLAANSTNYQDPNLSASTKYFYRVRGKNSAGNGDFSNVANATTSAPPTAKPAAPANLAAEAVSSSQINLSWNDVADETGYEVERSTDGNSFSKIGNDLGANSTSYQDNGLSASTKYFYRVRGKNSAGNGDFSNVANATTSAPPTVKPNAPANLTASEVSSSQINLSWNDVANETGYELERSTDGSGFTKIADLSANVAAYEDKNLSASTRYSYRVRAKNAAGESEFSNLASASTQASQNTALTAPRNLKEDRSKPAFNEISLIWENMAANSTGIEIWRSVVDQSNWGLVETINTVPAAVNYIDKSVRTGFVYFYKVRATKNNISPSDWSNVIEVSAPLVNGVEPELVVSAYPNPFEDILQLDFKSAGKIHIQIFNVGGQQVFDKKIDHGGAGTMIDLTDLATGAYWLQVGANAKKQTFKILKK